MKSQVETTFRSLSEALQDIFIHQRTGALECTVGGRREILYLLSGELYLSAGDPCRDRLERVLEGPGNSEDDLRFDPRAYLSRELSGVARELCETLLEWRVESVRLLEAPDALPDDIVGPVPTADLVMDLATHNADFEELVRRLGGRERSFRALADHRARRRVPYLRADDLALLQRLEKRESLGRLIAETAESLEVTRRLARLVAVGLVEAVDELSPMQASTPQDILAGISDRIAADLDAHPLDIQPELHRFQVETILGSYGRLGFYELLGVGSDTPSSEVHQAFMGLARLVHPKNAAKLGLESSEEQLEALMTRLAEAYLVLSDPEDADGYRSGKGVLKTPQPEVDTESEERRSEREEVARQSYQAALDCIEADDYFYAIQLLTRATQANPRAEYFAMLGHCQRQNPKWLYKAVDSFERALNLSPEDQELRRYLSEASQEHQEYLEASQQEQEPEPQPEPEEPTESQEARRVRRALSKLWPRSKERSAPDA